MIKLLVRQKEVCCHLPYEIQSRSCQCLDHLDLRGLGKQPVYLLLVYAFPHDQRWEWARIVPLVADVLGHCEEFDAERCTRLEHDLSLLLHLPPFELEQLCGEQLILVGTA